MKLNNAKMVEIVRKRNDGWSTNHIRKKFEVTERRVNQVLAYYRQHEALPELGKRLGRPMKNVSSEHTEIILDSYNKYRYSASLLEDIILRDYGVHIPHNTIHKVLLAHGRAERLNKEVVRRRKIVRYERKHSLSLGHMDWHQRPDDGIWVAALEDDASRALLALLETDTPTTEASICMVNNAGKKYGQFKQIITDRGSQFTCNQKGFEDSSLFEQRLKRMGVEHIKCRPKHPQTNGKVEKWFDTYERHRDAFSSHEEFSGWYNEIRPHTALNWVILETPMQAFQRKLKK
jgi:transposase InsO family protein